ncbi:tryptophan-rich sensory protein [Rhodococcus sp. CH91]|uniref:tryptophan-rich sensory protein n=1 Tax=Rhodococcus sp. CH91 TaxID=2910256 RepID=UPI001F4AF370|nr:tryptophan-rich sensory protein [Rhodococcus sp. CH91]
MTSPSHGSATAPASSSAPRTGRDIARVAAVAVSAPVAVVVSFFGSGAAGGTPVAEAAGGALSADATAVAPGGPAFSIWTLIYAGLLALAVWQALPAHHTDARQRAAGWWISASMLLNAAWITAIQFDQVWLSVVVIVALLAVLVRIFLIFTRNLPTSRLEAVVVDGTMFVYLGWVSVATVANTSAALRYEEIDPFGWGADVWAIVVLAVVAAVSVLLAIVGRGRLAVTGALVWGLIWIAVARTSDDGLVSTPAAVSAVTAAVVAVVATVAARISAERSTTRTAATV